MLGFEERGNLEYPEKNPKAASREENQQTPPTYDVEFRNRTRDRLMEGERSHHCAKPGTAILAKLSNCALR